MVRERYARPVYFQYILHLFPYDVFSAHVYLPELAGISKEQIDIHLKLYGGYVTHTNLIIEQIAALREHPSNANTFLMNELRRRLGFEFDGMRLHEYYFEQFEGGSVAADEGSPLSDAVAERYGSWEAFIAHFKEVTGTRGIGWTIVYFDPKGRTIHTAWVDEHHLGQFSTLPILLAIDLWEHAYMVDYAPAEKAQHVDAFLQNVNWGVVERRFLGEAV